MDIYETWKIATHKTYQDEESVNFDMRLPIGDAFQLNPTLTRNTRLEQPIRMPWKSNSCWAMKLVRCGHYGINAICEQGLWGDRSTELAGAAAIGRTIIDRKLSVGIEGEYSNETAEGSRGDPEISFLLGPSVQWRITPKTHLDLVPLFGLTHDSPHMESWVVLGI